MRRDWYCDPCALGINALLVLCVEMEACGLQLADCRKPKCLLNPYFKSVRGARVLPRQREPYGRNEGKQEYGGNLNNYVWRRVATGQRCCSVKYAQRYYRQ
jgi:hypothetical protein